MQTPSHFGCYFGRFSCITPRPPLLFSALKPPDKEADKPEDADEAKADGSDGGSEGPSDSPDSIVEEEEQAKGPDEDGEAAGAVSLHLLSKLKAMRQAGRAQAQEQAKAAQG